MYIRDECWEAFLEKQRGLPIVCFGAGMMPYHIEPLLVQWGVWDRILCFLDNDEKKEGIYVGTGKKIPVMTVEAFRKQNRIQFLVLITCETYEPVCRQLDQVPEWKEIECYIYPRLNYRIFSGAAKKEIVPVSEREQIPKVIHCCWFGSNGMGELQKMCIQSWKDRCPGYEIRYWNEKNYDIARSRYMQQAYSQQKWAFVSDYARLDLLYEYGGIYLDTDVEIISNIDGLLKQKAFISYGEWPAVNSGAGIGSVKGNAVLREMRDEPRSHIPFLYSDGTWNLTTNCVYESEVLRKYGFKQNFEMQMAGGFLVLPPDYFAPESVLGDELYRTGNTLAIHHCGGSWADEKRKRELQMTKKANRI